jgi:hypothetical protein
VERFLHRVGSVLLWTAVLVLGAFGTYFTFTNYPALGIAIALLIVVLVGYSERSRRQRQRTAERARMHRRRTQSQSYRQGHSA